jgi:hypothetical protein
MKHLNNSVSEIFNELPRRLSTGKVEQADLRMTLRALR